MYKFLGSMLDIASLIGAIDYIHMSQKTLYCDDCITIRGKMENGKEFELELNVRENKDDRN